MDIKEEIRKILYEPIDIELISDPLLKRKLQLKDFLNFYSDVCIIYIALNFVHTYDQYFYDKDINIDRKKFPTSKQTQKIVEKVSKLLELDDENMIIVSEECTEAMADLDYKNKRQTEEIHRVANEIREYLINDEKREYFKRFINAVIHNLEVNNEDMKIFLDDFENKLKRIEELKQHKEGSNTRQQNSSKSPEKKLQKLVDESKNLNVKKLKQNLIKIADIIDNCTKIPEEILNQIIDLIKIFISNSRTQNSEIKSETKIISLWDDFATKEDKIDLLNKIIENKPRALPGMLEFGLFSKVDGAKYESVRELYEDGMISIVQYAKIHEITEDDLIYEILTKNEKVNSADLKELSENGILTVGMTVAILKKLNNKDLKIKGFSEPELKAFQYEIACQIISLIRDKEGKDSEDERKIREAIGIKNVRSKGKKQKNDNIIPDDIEPYVRGKQNIFDPIEKFLAISKLTRNAPFIGYKNGYIEIKIDLDNHEEDNKKIILEKIFEENGNAAYGAATYVIDANFWHHNKMNYISDDNQILLRGKNGAPNLSKSGLYGVDRFCHNENWRKNILEYFGITDQNSSIYSQEEIEEIRKAFQSITIIPEYN